MSYWSNFIPSMNNELSLLKFRLLQAYRFVKYIGLIYIILLIPILAIMLLMLAASLEHNANPYFLTAFYPVLISLVHGARKDIPFLQKINIRTSILFLIEYQLVCIPLTLMMVFINYTSYALAGHSIVIFLSFILSKINYTLKGINSNWKLDIIPLSLFEWKGLIRRYHYKLIAFWILGLFMSINEYAIFFFVFIFTSLIPVVFKPTEGKEFKPSGTKDLLLKLMRNSIFLGLITLPHLIIYTILNPEIWFVSIGIFIYFQLNQLYAINFKYAYFSQYKDSSNEIPTIIFLILCPFVPLSIPLILFMYFKAKKNLLYA